MPLINRIIWMAGSLLFIGFALWLSITMIGFVLLAGGVMVIGYAVRQFLLDKGILNPRPGVPMDPPSAAPHITVIETEYTRVDKKESR